MNHHWAHRLLLAVVTGSLAGCAAHSTSHPVGNTSSLEAQLQSLRLKFAPDAHMAIYDVDFTQRGDALILSGETDSKAAHRETIHAAGQTGWKIVDHIRVLPDAELGETNWGITTLSVANGREQEEHKAELGTQTLMGEVVRVLKRDRRWLFVQTHDQYLSWMETGSLKICTRAAVDAWEQSPLLIVTEVEVLIREAPEPDAPPISDMVLAGRVQQTGETGEWFKVELPDGRSGYLPKLTATNYPAWKKSRQPTPASIERVARQLVGRPYFWGANTPRGMDCSGLTKLVFLMNGIELHRNASQQARQGVEVPIDRDLSRLRKGDLLFFGFERPGDEPGRISHTGIYLGNKLFIQSSQRVRISSLDPDSPLADKTRIRGLIKARRVLPEN